MFFDDFEELQFDDPDDLLYSMYCMMFLRERGTERTINSQAYYRWSEEEMADSHLLSYKPVAPAYQRTNSINGGHWFIIDSLQKDQITSGRGGWLAASHEISTHRRITEMSQQISLLLDAWSARYRSLNMQWNSELGQTRKTPGLDWFRTQRCTQEGPMTLENRARQSVERGMAIFRSEEEFDQLYQEIRSVVNLVPNLLMKILADAIPVHLPYTALALISSYVLDQESADCSTMKTSEEDIPGQIVESRYIGRLYLSLLDIHTALTELMFRHLGETAAPNFPDKFLYLRNLVQRNKLFLQTYHEPSLENTDQHLKETKVTDRIFCII